MNNQYKVGDKVRVIGNKHGHEFPIGEIVELTEQVNSERKSWRAQGKSNPRYASVRFWCITEDEFEPVTFPDEIHISVKGNKTIAVHKNNGKLVKRAEAICCPSDEFDFAVGAKLAMDRLFEDKPKEEPRFKVGDKVKFHSWEDMVGKKIRHGFTQDMKHLCGTTATIESINGEDVKLTNFSATGDAVTWDYSTDMLEPYTEPEQKEPIKLYCFKSHKKILTKGTVYDLSDGFIHYDDGRKGHMGWFDGSVDELKKSWLPDYLVPLISRPAKVGEYVKLSDDMEWVAGFGATIGSVYKVSKIDGDGDIWLVSETGCEFCQSVRNNYLVLDGYNPKEPFKPYLELCGEIMGYIGENSPSTAYGNVPLKVGDTILVTSGCENGKEKLIVGKKEAGSLSSTAENGNWWFGRSVKIRNYTELKDGETVDGITAHLTEKGE